MSSPDLPEIWCALVTDLAYLCRPPDPYRIAVKVDIPKILGATNGDRAQIQCFSSSITL